MYYASTAGGGAMAIVFRDQPGPTGMIRKPAKDADGRPAGRKGPSAGSPAIACRGCFTAAAAGGVAASSRPGRRRG